MTTETIIDSKGGRHFITFERHGYRTRIWEDRRGYIGSFMHTNKRVGYRAEGPGKLENFEGYARGRLDAARQLVEFHIW